MVGIVTGMKENSPTEFCVHLFSEQSEPTVRIGDIVRVALQHKGRVVTYYGIVNDITSQWDRDVDSGFKERAVFDQIMPGNKFFLARVAVSRAVYPDREVFDEPLMVPSPGTPVFLVRSYEEVERALRFDELKKRGSHLPVGVMINEQPAYIDLSFVLGENGAHVNISGQSGVAAKTSYATFLVAAMIQKGDKENNAYAQALRNGRYIVFNVKGESLFFLDCRHPDWVRAEESQVEIWQRMYRSMGLDPDWTFPKDRVMYCSSPKGSKLPELDKPDLKSRFTNTSVYGWDFIDVIRYRLLELALDQEELAMSQNMQLVLFAIQEKLEELLEEFINDVERVERELQKGKTNGQGVWEDLAKAIESIHFPLPPDRYEKARQVLYACRKDPELILAEYGLPETVDQLTEYLKRGALAKDEDYEDRAVAEWAKVMSENDIGRATMFAVIRRLKLARKQGLDRLWRPMPHCLAGELTSAPQFSYRITAAWDRPGGVTVIDISKLHSSMQSFVVGAVLRQVLEAKMANPNASQQPVFVFLDELNKYAPRMEGTAMVKLFRDVAERGRSFGVILIGAEQTASQVDFRVVTQSSTTVVGHQKAAELSHDEYKHLLLRQKEMLSSVGPGVVFVDQPFLRVPIMVKFPMTPWSTKETNECESASGDLAQYL